jgi:hypothetical protein
LTNRIKQFLSHKILTSKKTIVEDEQDPVESKNQNRVAPKVDVKQIPEKA